MNREPDLERYEGHARNTAYGTVSEVAGRTYPPTAGSRGPTAGGVQYQLEVLEKLTAEAHSLLDRLASRIEPVIESVPAETPRNNVKGLGETMESSQLGQRMELMVAALRELCGRMDALTSRIRL